MIKSMTGYGCAQGTSGKLGLSIEIRSVNNRYLDCTIRIPRIYTYAEDAMKTLVQKYVSRGKVEVYVYVDSTAADDVVVKINEPLALAYAEALSEMSQKFGLERGATAMSLSRFQDVLTVEKKETDREALEKDLCAVLEDALKGYDAMRRTEGRKLYEDISLRLEEIGRLTDLAEERSPVTVAEYRQRLTDRMTEILETKQIDENRILLEAAIFADRVAVNEEIVRLRSHVSLLKDMIGMDEPVGRKLDFLIQELNREANTMGSKGNDVEMARIVVDLKAEIEKIREQVQNVE